MEIAVRPEGANYQMNLPQIALQALVAQAFSTPINGTITAKHCEAYAKLLRDLIEGQFSLQYNVEVRADNDLCVVVWTITGHGFREERTVEYSVIGAVPPKPKEREKNPAPEVDNGKKKK